MDWPRLDTRWWNLSIGATATTVLAACGPLVTLDGETDTAAETDTDPTTDPDATDTTPTVQCNNGSDCQPGEECIDNVCMPYDYYCQDGGCCYDHGCCYDDCCYGECYYEECYSDEQCGPLGLCTPGGECQTPQPLYDCGDGLEITVLELPAVSEDEFVSLAFVDVDGDPAQDLVIGRNGSAELHRGGGAPAIALPVPPDVAVVDAVSGSFDGDGNADIVASTAEGRLLVMAGDGAGGFTLVQDLEIGAALYDLAALQWNGDGALDLAGVSTGGQAMIHWGAGDGSFLGNEVLPTFGDVYSLALTDFGGDDYGDLVAEDQVAGQVFLGDFSGDLTRDYQLPGNLHGERRLLSADIGGGFVHEVVGYTPKPGWLLLELWSDGLDGPALYAVEDEAVLADMGDHDGDGLNDVVVVGSSTVHIVRGSDDPGFSFLSCQSTFFFGDPIQSMAVGDYSGNGRADIAIQSLGSVFMLMVL